MVSSSLVLGRSLSYELVKQSSQQQPVTKIEVHDDEKNIFPCHGKMEKDMNNLFDCGFLFWR